MKHTAETLPIVDFMMVRKITPLKSLNLIGGVIVMDEYNVENVGIVEERLGFDDDVIDCSFRIFDITTQMIGLNGDHKLSVFPSRRWRNHREGEDIVSLPSEKEPLLYIGNPIKLFKGEDGISVVRTSEFLIKSGLEIGF